MRRVWLHCYANADGNRESNFNSYGYSHSDTNADADSDSNCNSHVNADCHINSDSYSNRDRNSYSHRHGDAMHGKMSTDTEATTNSSTTRVGWSWFLDLCTIEN